MFEKIKTLLMILFGIYAAYHYVVLIVVSIYETVRDFFTPAGDILDMDYVEHGPGPGAGDF